MNPSAGLTHNPRFIRVNSGSSSVVFNQIETSRTLTNGAIGSTGYIGATVDTDGEGVGLYGFFPVGSSRTNTINTPSIVYGSGITHYGGYTCPPLSGLSGGVTSAQIIQVRGTDSATADYWIVNHHINSIGLDDLGVTGVNEVYRIPVQQVTTNDTQYPVYGNRSGYGSFGSEKGFTLNGGATYIIGEIVRQKKWNEPEAIGRVLQFKASGYHQGLGTPYWNNGIDWVTVEVLNGKFSKYLDSSRVYRPITGDDSGCSRLVDQSYNGNIHTSVTHDTSWMDVPIEIIINDITVLNSVT
jgi:hypothetical protein